MSRRLLPTMNAPGVILLTRLAIALGLASTTVAQLPDLPSQRGANGSGGGWSHARWGMTQEQIKAAFPGVVTTQRVELPKGVTDMIGMDRVDLAGIPFRALFAFDGNGGLNEVAFHLPDSTQSETQFRKLEDWLSNEYGQGPLRGAAGTNVFYSFWLLPNNVIRVIWTNTGILTLGFTKPNGETAESLLKGLVAIPGKPSVGGTSAGAAPTAAAIIDPIPSSPSEPLEPPAWLAVFPGSIHYVKTATRADVGVAYTAPDSASAVTGFYKDQFHKGEVTSSASFDGIGTTIQASATGQTCVLRISDADAGTNVNVKCAPTAPTSAPAVSQQPTRLPPGVHLVEYSISGSAGAAGLTYRNATGGTEQNEVSLPQTFRFYAASGSFVYLSAQNKTDAGYVHVSITVDGTSLQEATAGSAYGIATASGSLPR